ncbi:transposable element Tc1 transposase [Trichonephila clavipes]|nr:transposable element Tc1 transposase [Trichonephila clavipes]
MPSRRIRAHYEQLSEFEIGCIIGMKEGGWANWRIAHHTVFSDESHFHLCPDDHRRRVWIRPGQRADPAFTISHHPGHQHGVMVREHFFLRRTPLSVIRGTLTAHRYVEGILRTVLLPFLLQYSGFIFQHDSAIPRTTRVAMNCVTAYQTLSWPTRLPDSSPIKHAWDMMGRRLHQQGNVDDLARQLEQIWQEIPQETIMFTCKNCGGGDRGRVAIYRPFGEVSLSLNRTVTCMVLKADDRRTSCPCHDEFRGPRSDYVRQTQQQGYRQAEESLSLCVVVRLKHSSDPVQMLMLCGDLC